MTTRELKDKYLKFFEEKGHKIIPSASLIPENDPTVLFTTAGMHPLVPYLLGEKHPMGNKLVNVQKCLRTNDIDKVGDAIHNTFFEMLGYWSFGDYFKKESIHFTFDFYTKILDFNKDNISVTVFEGDETASFDEESYSVWKNEIGIPAERIYRYPKKENWWGPAGKTGPCGPCTEMFIDTGKPKCSENCGPACNCGKFVEIGNNVFMEYSKTTEGKFKKLKQKNVDVGLGLERLVMISENKESVYDIDLFVPIIKKIEEISGLKYGGENIKAFRIIADHLRAATFILAEELEPSNLEQGYVLRRLIRRAIRYGKKLGIDKPFTHEIGKLVIDLMSSEYSELKKNEKFILEQFNQEEEKFENMLGKWMKGKELKELEKVKIELKKIFNSAIGGVDPENLPEGMIIKGNTIRIDGKKVFNIYQTSGVPIEVLQEIMTEWGVAFDEETIKEAENALKQHQELSRTATAGKFKSGLADNSEQVTKLHTATHLLLAALRQVLGNNVFQKGSNITAERLRLDFSHSEKLTAEQLKKVEDIVNEQIKKDLLVSCCEMSLDEAKKSGAMGVFESKYNDKVKVYSVGNFSCEICAGPHVGKTGQLGHFKILKEEASSSGVRRIKAILE